VSAELDPLQELFAAAQQGWRRAVQAHRMAPPDAGFSRRLADLAAVAREESRVCRTAAAAGYSWPSHTSNVEQPYELRPGTGRRGPKDLWQRFDRAVDELTRAAAGTDLTEVAAAHELLADAADDLATAVAHEDRASGLLHQPALRDRRSA
jgi:hypothetical protein